MGQEIQFAKNIKTLRKQAGFTRHELAERLHYSDKAIEKWETGQSLPALPEICKLSQMFGVTLEQLVYEQKKEIKYFLGIDGGGTKTKLVLVNAAGTELASCELGPSNPNDIGMEKCFSVLKQGISLVTDGINRHEISVFAGMAGGLSGDNDERIHRFLSGFEFGHVENGSDVENALELCLQGKDGVVVIAGTGNIVFAQKNGKRKRIGGWGYLLDDGGSGYNLGRDALDAAYRMIDGRGASTMLLSLIERKLEMSMEDAIPHIYQGGKKLIGSLSACVFEACDAGDAIAIAILKRNLKYIGETLQTAVDYMEQENVSVVICGGLTKRSDLLEKYIQEYLPKNCNLQFSTEPMVAGAILLAKKNLS